MPKLLIYESRRLVLPLETVVDALLELDRERGGRLSTAMITDARIETGESPCLTLEALQTEALTPERHSFPLPAIAAAVIHYCWKSKVPLPRKGTKSIEIVPEGFALTVQGTVEVSQRYRGLAPRAPASASGSADEARASGAE